MVSIEFADLPGDELARRKEKFLGDVRDFRLL